MQVPENIGYTQRLNSPAAVFCLCKYRKISVTLNGLILLLLFSVYASTGKYRLHSMASPAAVFGLCKYRKISVTLNGFSCCCFRFMQVPENIGYTQWLLLLLFSVYASTEKYRLHSMASLAAVFGLCKYRKISVTLNGFSCCCFRFIQVPENIGYTQWLNSLAAVFGLCKYRKISVTLNGFSCCCFRFMQVPENIGYTQWLLLLLFSVYASTMSELQTKNKTKQNKTKNKQTNKKQKQPPPPPQRMYPSLRDNCKDGTLLCWLFITTGKTDTA